MDINEEIKKICKQHNLPYRFKIDHGNFETAIEFWAMGYFHPPKSKDWEEARKEQREIKCPDLLDYENKLIIEYEEESKPGKSSGKMGKKGHWEENKRDENRDYLYRIGGFKVLKLWESEYKDDTWKVKLEEFLREIII